MEVETKLQTVQVSNSVPRHAQVFADTILTRFFPGFNGESPSVKDPFYFLLQSSEFIWRVGTNTSVINVCVLQDGLENGGLEVGGESGINVLTVATFAQVA